MVDTTTRRDLTIGEKIRQVRQALGITQEQLAGSEYTKGFVSAVERGESGISDEALELFAERLGKPVAYFRLDAKSFELSLAEAQRMLDEGRPEEAEKKLLELLEAETLQRRQRALVQRWLGRTYLDLDKPGEAIHHLSRAYNAFETMGDRQELERTRRLIGVAHFRRGNLPEAVRLHEQVMEAVRQGVIRDPSFAIEIHNDLGHEYQAMGEHQRALTHYQEVLRISNEAENLSGLASTHWNLALSYRQSGEYDAALHHARYALALFDTLGNRRLAGQVQVNIGSVYAEQGEWERAREAFEKSLEAARVNNDTVGRAAALASLVEYYAATGQGQRAIEIVPELLAAAESGGQPAQRSMAMLRAATAYAAAGQIDKASELYERAIELFRQQEQPTKEAEACFRYAEMLRAAGQIEKSVEFYRRAYEVANPARVS